ncbi:hypothetical protein [Paremcibacter congregatus]|uniref:hypothetical protein n=1 Tax=Paremcibacter congregatus TaxID=2043170 RepID=UPI003A919753
MLIGGYGPTIVARDGVQRFPLRSKRYLKPNIVLNGLQTPTETNNRGAVTMPKQDVMDMWAALQWVVRDQMADRAFASNDDARSMTPGGSVTAAVMRMGELNARVDGGGAIHGSELDPDAERIWMGVLMLLDRWRRGMLRDEIGVGLTAHMQRAMARLASRGDVNPIYAAVDAARSGDMPEWYRLNAGYPRRVVEESRLYYVLVWDVLTCLYKRLSTSHSMGIVIEMPSIPRLPWQGGKKVLDDCA